MPTDLLAQRVAGLKQVLQPTRDLDSLDLAQKRHQNDLHLQGTLESIYQKYSKDFTDVGDEINILTGEVILDRGHVERMENELDDGTGPSRAPRTTCISALVEEDSEIEEMESDEDELCSGSIEPVKPIRGGKCRDKVIPSPEDAVAVETSSPLENISDVSPKSAFSSQRPTPVMTPLLPSNIPSDPPPLEAVLESFKQSITQQWQSLVNSYFPTQMTPSTGHHRIQTITPHQTPAFYTSPTQSMITRTEPAKLRFLGATNSADVSTPRSLPANRHSLLPTELTGDVARLRLRSPAGTPSLWAAPESKKRGRPRKLPIHQHLRIVNKQERSLNRPSPRISSLLNLSDDDEDELASNSGFIAQAGKPNFQREGPEQPRTSLVAASGHTEGGVERSEAPPESTELFPGPTLTALDGLAGDDSDAVGDVDSIDATDGFPGDLGGNDVGTSLSQPKSAKQRHSHSMHDSISRKRKRSDSTASYQESSDSDLPDATYISKTAKQGRIEHRYREQRSTGFSMERKDLQVVENSANGSARITTHATWSASRSDSTRGPVMEKTARMSSASVPVRPLSRTPEPQQIPVATPRRERSLSQTHSSSGIPDRKKKRRSLLIQSLPASSINNPNTSAPNTGNSSLLTSLNDLESLPQMSVNTPEHQQDRDRAAMRPSDHQRSETTSADHELAQTPSQSTIETRPESLGSMNHLRNPLITVRGLPRKSRAGRPPKPGWTVENDAKLIHMVTVQKLTWHAIFASNEFPNISYGCLLHHYYRELGGPLKRTFTMISNAPRECENCHAKYVPSKRLNQSVDPLCISCSIYARTNEGRQRPV